MGNLQCFGKKIHLIFFIASLSYVYSLDKAIEKSISLFLSDYVTVRYLVKAPVNFLIFFQILQTLEHPVCVYSILKNFSDNKGPSPYLLKILKQFN